MNIKNKIIIILLIYTLFFILYYYCKNRNNIEKYDGFTMKELKRMDIYLDFVSDTCGGKNTVICNKIAESIKKDDTISRQCIYERLNEDEKYKLINLCKISGSKTGDFANLLESRFEGSDVYFKLLKPPIVLKFKKFMLDKNPIKVTVELKYFIKNSGDEIDITRIILEATYNITSMFNYLNILHGIKLCQPNDYTSPWPSQYKEFLYQSLWIIYKNLITIYFSKPNKEEENNIKKLKNYLIPNNQSPNKIHNQSPYFNPRYNDFLTIENNKTLQLSIIIILIILTQFTKYNSILIIYTNQSPIKCNANIYNYMHLHKYFIDLFKIIKTRTNIKQHIIRLQKLKNFNINKCDVYPNLDYKDPHLLTNYTEEVPGLGLFIFTENPKEFDKKLKFNWLIYISFDNCARTLRSKDNNSYESLMSTIRASYNLTLSSSSTPLVYLMYIYVMFTQVKSANIFNHRFLKSIIYSICIGVSISDKISADIFNNYINNHEKRIEFLTIVLVLYKKIIKITIFRVADTSKITSDRNEFTGLYLKKYINTHIIPKLKSIKKNDIYNWLDVFTICNKLSNIDIKRL